MLYESARKALNAQHDITQKEMAEACGVSESTISRYLSATSSPAWNFWSLSSLF